ncbi:MAG TPA: hypothetical protein VF472_21985 [Burkholderiaceae bacterium]
MTAGGLPSRLDVENMFVGIVDGIGDFKFLKTRMACGFPPIIRLPASAKKIVKTPVFGRFLLLLIISPLNSRQPSLALLCARSSSLGGATCIIVKNK